MNDRARILVIILVVAVVGGIAGIGIYRERVAPFRMVVLRVDDDVQVRMRYFLKRVAVGGQPALEMLNVITREELILKGFHHGCGVSRVVPSTAQRHRLLRRRAP